MAILFEFQRFNAPLIFLIIAVSLCSLFVRGVIFSKFPRSSSSIFSHFVLIFSGFVQASIMFFLSIRE